MMSFSRGAIAGYLGLVFVSGVAVGGFGHRLYAVSSVLGTDKPMQSPEEMRKQYVDTMRTRLKLNDDQVMKLNLILDESRGRFHEVQSKTRPEMDAIRQYQIDSIHSLLSPEQNAAYDQLRKERDEARKHAGPRGGPGF
jgi:hypothetical protein